MYGEYTVEVNENINDISRRFGVSIDEIARLNPNININQLQAGQIIRIPNIFSESFKYYIVKKGDSLYKIAAENNTDVNMIAQINGLDIYDYLYPGQRIMVPKEGVKLYITEDGDTLRSVAIKTKNTLNSIILENSTIYLLPGQLLIYRE